MPSVRKVKADKGNEDHSKIKILLKNKLKLDDNIIGLLVNSKGSLKYKSFSDRVLKQISKG
ncbi:MAG: hypothetical protein LH629_04165 [Ignavibacteria bacterium]|nr:hypothetical protein [Ignavibacteria bacterium]